MSGCWGFQTPFEYCRVLCCALYAPCFAIRPVCSVIMWSWKIYLFKVRSGVGYGDFAGEISSLCKWGVVYSGLFGPPLWHSSAWARSTYHSSFRHFHCILLPFNWTLNTRKLTASPDTFQNAYPMHVHSRRCCHLSGEFVLCYIPCMFRHSLFVSIRCRYYVKRQQMRWAFLSN
jgi:hypothetical protein